MTKRQLIDEIRTMNGSAEPAFLAKFGDEQLEAYLHHLRTALSPRPLEARQRGRAADPAAAPGPQPLEVAVAVAEPPAEPPAQTVAPQPSAGRWRPPAGARPAAAPEPPAAASAEDHRATPAAPPDRPDRAGAQPAREPNPPPDESNRSPFATSDEEMPAWLF